MHGLDPRHQYVDQRNIVLLQPAGDDYVNGETQVTAFKVKHFIAEVNVWEQLQSIFVGLCDIREQAEQLPDVSKCFDQIDADLKALQRVSQVVLKYVLRWAGILKCQSRTFWQAEPVSAG